MSLAAMLTAVTAVVTLLVGIVLILAGCLLGPALNTERGWGLSHEGWLAFAAAVLGTLLTSVALTVLFPGGVL